MARELAEQLRKLGRQIRPNKLQLQKAKHAEKIHARRKGTQQTSSNDIRSFFVFGQDKGTSENAMKDQVEECASKKHKAQGESAKEMPSLKGLCWNVRGLTTVLHELAHLVEQQAPDYIILTETKLRNKSKYRRKLTKAL